MTTSGLWPKSVHTLRCMSHTQSSSYTKKECAHVCKWEAKYKILVAFTVAVAHVITIATKAATATAASTRTNHYTALPTLMPMFIASVAAVASVAHMQYWIFNLMRLFSTIFARKCIFHATCCQLCVVFLAGFFWVFALFYGKNVIFNA